MKILYLYMQACHLNSLCAGLRIQVMIDRIRTLKKNRVRIRANKIKSPFYPHIVTKTGSDPSGKSKKIATFLEKRIQVRPHYSAPQPCLLAFNLKGFLIISYKLRKAAILLKLFLVVRPLLP